MASLTSLLAEIRSRQRCEPHLPFAARPVFQMHAQARVLIAGQAPGRRVHESCFPFNDPSGDRFRAWMGITREVFYDEKRIALSPRGFCDPGTGKSSDLPSRAECALAWQN